MSSVITTAGRVSFPFWVTGLMEVSPIKIQSMNKLRRNMKMKFINVDYKAPMKNPDIDIQSQSDKCV